MKSKHRRKVSKETKEKDETGSKGGKREDDEG